ncbi:hypothetical protein L873DRAFT_1830043 [Choiromyces venosus 120613-1]|uniref:Ribosomal RNA-processing protein 14 N-terminal domain-containing protein n=1 Tax=Choiromyces venosus 120613-1 TaxID=1336337 RepID=A0A3N4JA42_9PEZI|nr:hypothetical protein L873DRAFT_1830043 [Choiromyces venosus 120613-1]
MFILPSSIRHTDRLQSHSRAFASLLELIPSKYYYGDKDNTSQWNKRKQTKAQSAIARKAKLDPDAIDVEPKLEAEPADKQNKKLKNNEKKERKDKKASTTLVATAITTGKDEDDNYKDMGEEEEGGKEAEQIVLDNFAFTTELDDLPSASVTSTSAKNHDISTGASTGAEDVTTTQKADHRARLAAKIQGLKEKHGGHPPSATVSANKSSKRKNAEAKKRKKDQKRQKTGSC